MITLLLSNRVLLVKIKRVVLESSLVYMQSSQLADTQSTTVIVFEMHMFCKPLDIICINRVENLITVCSLVPRPSIGEMAW